ncbi:MAG: hypothetical protein QNK11_04580 [Legionella sp.]|nr:hypothetical protein [Legionella sp.]
MRLLAAINQGNADQIRRALKNKKEKITSKMLIAAIDKGIGTLLSLQLLLALPKPELSELCLLASIEANNTLLSKKIIGVLNQQGVVLGAEYLFEAIKKDNVQVFIQLLMPNKAASGREVNFDVIKPAFLKKVSDMHLIGLSRRPELVHLIKEKCPKLKRFISEANLDQIWKPSKIKSSNNLLLLGMFPEDDSGVSNGLPDFGNKQFYFSSNKHKF